MLKCTELVEEYKVCGGEQGVYGECKEFAQEDKECGTGISSFMSLQQTVGAWRFLRCLEMCLEVVAFF